MPEMGFTFGEIMQMLAPRPAYLLTDILLYIMFILNFIAFFGQDDKQIMATMLVGATLAGIMIAKLGLIRDTHLIMLLINVGIFAVPLVVTGMSKAKKVKPLTLIAGLVGGFYFFLFWFIFQRI